jgi:aryl-alcohol dehydrogenase-like predicted oxidoreductase
MKTRQLGRSGIHISPLMFGGNVFGWTVDEASSFALLDEFVGNGFNAIDTADVYSVFLPGNTGGESETVIGRWLQRTGKRDQVVIATKVGAPMSPDKQGLSRDYIIKAAEDSLRRLQTDYIDVYFAHQDDPATPLEETLAAFADLVRQGKVRAIGASNYSAARLQEALTVSSRLNLPRYECLQPLYNLYERGYEQDLEPPCVANQIGVVPYFALASGFLTGKYRSAADLAKSPRGALAWLMARPSVTAPIASATSLNQLRDIMAAVRLQLDQDAIASLNTASAATNEN